MSWLQIVDRRSKVSNLTTVIITTEKICTFTFSNLKTSMSTMDDIIAETPEQETQEDFLNAEEDLVEQKDQTSFDIIELGELVKVASEGALTSKTMSNYRRYWPLTTSSENL
jgi:hypothetical protein